MKTLSVKVSIFLFSTILLFSCTEQNINKEEIEVFKGIKLNSERNSLPWAEEPSSLQSSSTWIYKHYDELLKYNLSTILEEGRVETINFGIYNNRVKDVNLDVYVPKEFDPDGSVFVSMLIDKYGNADESDVNKRTYSWKKNGYKIALATPMSLTLDFLDDTGVRKLVRMTEWDLRYTSDYLSDLERTEKDNVLFNKKKQRLDDI